MNQNRGSQIRLDISYLNQIYLIQSDMSYSIGYIRLSQNQQNWIWDLEIIWKI
jgi:hypothetical protein